MVGRADNAFIFHLLNEPRRTIIADLQIGYNRAARLIEQMEDEGVISAPNHAGKREVLAGKQ